MNENLKRFIGKPISVSVKFIVDGSLREEYIQGILKAVESDTITINQHIPFSNLFIKDAETNVFERFVEIQSLSSNGIKTF